MRPETYAYAITLKLPDGTTAMAAKPQWAHSEWSAGAQYLRKHKGAKIASVARIQQ